MLNKNLLLEDIEIKWNIGRKWVKAPKHPHSFRRKFFRNKSGSVLFWMRAGKANIDQ